MLFCEELLFLLEEKTKKLRCGANLTSLYNLLLWPSLSGRVSGPLQTVMRTQTELIMTQIKALTVTAHTGSSPAEVEIQLFHVLGFPPMAQRNACSPFILRGLLLGQFFRQVRAHLYHYLYIFLRVFYLFYFSNLAAAFMGWEGSSGCSARSFLPNF